MGDNKSIVAFEPRTLQEFIQVGDIFAASGYFKEARSGAQAIVKIMAGREMGLGLFESMNGFYIIEGRMSMAANLIATLVQRSEKYDYRVKVLTREACQIEFYHKGKALGISEFTMEDAQKAQLIKKNGAWEKWPTNMLFARAMSNGVRFYCPEITGGKPIYTPDELGAEVDEQGEIIDMPTITAPARTVTHTITEAREDEAPEDKLREEARATNGVGNAGKDGGHKRVGVIQVMRDNYKWNPKKTINTLNKMVDEGRGSWDMTDDELLSELLAREEDKDNKDERPIDAAEDLARQAEAEAAPTLVERIAAVFQISPDKAVDWMAAAEEDGVDLSGEPAEVAARLAKWNEGKPAQTTLGKYFDAPDQDMADATLRAIGN